MTAPISAVTVSFSPSMAMVDRDEWDRLAGGAPPFMRWEWLSLLEASGAVAPATGWLPAHCLARASGRLVAAAPLYVKGHGQGEFVYDQLWAEAAHRLGLPYYPKLVAASPFTPVAGYAFLCEEGLPRPSAARALLAAMDRLALANGLSGLHVLFAGERFADELEALGFATWEHQGFLWENAGYASFEDFLGRFKAGQRKNIRRERERLVEAGVRVETVRGEDAPESWWGLMHHYYADTCSRFGEWGCDYLPREFFLGLSGEMAKSLAFSAAFLPGGGDPVGLALLALDAHTLYGRYWGAAKDIPFLHFELCYYAPIEWAIELGLKRFDPGMGGEHKPRRGFDSRLTRSLHRYYEPAMARVFARNAGQVNEFTRDYCAELAAMNAYKRGGSP
jgi:hypothetical protein